KERGYEIICADSIAHEILELNASRVAQLFGSQLLSGSKVDRKALGAIVFANPSAKKSLEELLHPLIHERICFLANELEKTGKLYFVDIPLFFESGGRAKYDFATSLLVYAPKELCLKRILCRDKADDTSANARINSQMDIEKKRALADFVLENTSDLASLEHGLKVIIEQIKTKMSLQGA
ncbi:MAG: dephospho-CoA kinase, partial [Campylobacter sp.]|uniref:dephospho-CoA kinase n=1 Tax=Campylobacter sp. TaxID=205 RepID=UPI002A91A631